MSPHDPTTYRIPARVCQSEIRVSNSRFVTTVAPAKTVDEAKTLIANVRAESPDASHHVYAYRIGYGNSVVEGMSDDREPSGTAGAPTLAVLRGVEIGDIVVVTTRYFGGTKLGTGGLVRAYSDAARTALATLETELRIPRQLVSITVPYPDYEPLKRLMSRHQGKLVEETFTDTVMILVALPAAEVLAFTRAVSDLTAGRVTPIVVDTYP